MAKGYSLHIGLNAVNPNHYNGWDGQLNACEADALSMAEIATGQGFETTILLTSQATRATFESCMQQYADKVQEGDIFLLTYSGHGGQIPDLNHDESDEEDETWCLFDSEIIDDEIYTMYCSFRSKVRILVFSDSCHSGTVTKLAAFKALGAAFSNESRPVYRYAPPEVMLGTYLINKAFYNPILRKPKKNKSDLKASVRLFSGCQDNQLSQDGTFNGLFTSRMMRVWADGNFKGNYAKFHKSIVKRMSDTPTQTPEHFVIGPKNKSFDAQKPFAI